jgi:hypothetical protein
VAGMLKHLRSIVAVVSRRFRSQAVVESTVNLLKLGIEISQATSTTTTGPAPISHSTRIAQTHARSCHPGADESSPSRKSMACITATNVSPPDRCHFPFANGARLLLQPSEDREIRAPAISTVGKACQWLDRSDLLLAPIQ